MPSGIIRTHEDFINDMKVKHPTFTILGHYERADILIAVKCNKCGHEWKTRPNSLYRNGKCPKCEASNRKPSQAEFVNKINKLNPSVVPIENYINGETPILFECKTCGRQWKSRPNNILQGKRCIVCTTRENAKRLTTTQEEFETKLKTINDKIQIVGKYINAKTYIECKCLICGHVWQATPSNLLSNFGCPQCAMVSRGLKQRKSHSDFLDELKKLNKNLIPLEEYSGSHTPIKFQCNVCGNIWKTAPNVILFSNSGCPQCVASYGEQKIIRFLENNHITYESQKKFVDLFGLGGGQLSYDFYIPNQNVLIEYQGQFHDGTVSFQTEESFKKQKAHDKLKREYAENHNIKLLEIWYKDYKRVDEILAQNLVS